MKQKQHILSAVCAAVLLAAPLAGCGSTADSTPSDSTSTVSDPVPQTEPVIESTTSAEQTSEQTTTLSTDAALTESTSVLTTSTAPQARRDDWLDSIGTLAEGGYVAQLRCSGTVYARDGLNLRQKPSTAANKLTKLKNGTKLDITGITAAGSVTDYQNRWLRVKANGQEGYVLAEYVNAECSLPLDQLTGEEIGALAILLYYQAERLDMEFRREGGLQGTRTDEYDSEGYARVKPDGLTIAKLRDSYHHWFTADSHDDFDELYTEKNNAIWVMTGYGDNVALEYTIPERLKDRTNNTLTYEVRAQWYPEFDMTMDGSDTNLHDFKIVYTDGLWKVTDFKPLY